MSSLNQLLKCPLIRHALSTHLLSSPRQLGAYQRTGYSNRGITSPKRRAICSASEPASLSGRGLVLGCYATDSGYELTECSKELNRQTNGKLDHVISKSGGPLKNGDCRLFYDFHDNAHCALVGFAQEGKTPHNEDIDTNSQSVRSAAARGVKLLQSTKIAEISVDDFSDAQSSAEGCGLSVFSFDKLKSPNKQKKLPNIKLLSKDPVHSDNWNKGQVFAHAQNFARELMETPSNLLTPSIFVDRVSRTLGDISRGMTRPQSLSVVPRPLSWIEEQKMGAFLSIAKGSSELPWLLEVRYNYQEGQSQQPIVLVGKGVTFDTGGISIKPSSGMGLMRGDMGGAACVVATATAIARLAADCSVVCLVPLCENMPSGSAVKPGDVVVAMNGKSIEVDNTDAEGRLLLADTLCYAHSFNPGAIIDLATLTGAMDVALGAGAAGVFTTSDSLWNQLHQAGHVTGDRLWRMPLYDLYSKQIESHFADISNIGKKSRSGGACTAAAFLKEFVRTERWAHLDIAGVMESHGESPFLGNGMSGRPTRTLIQYILDSQQN